MTGSPDMIERPTRRRFITLTAAAAGMSLAPRIAQCAKPKTLRWRGVALGAEASLLLQHPDEAHAKMSLSACLAEVDRLERIFSLHRPDSALVRLNRDGRIDDAPADLRILLSEALTLCRETNGAFDPTIQPLWALYTRHFASPDADPQGPAMRDIAEAKARTGWQHVILDGGMVRFGKPGMAMTLNGIAQGYITDKAADLLRDLGFENVLINLGEQRALGPQSDGRPWRAGVRDPKDPDRILTEIELSGLAMATSSGAALAFDRPGRFAHILNPTSGLPAATWASISVVAERATRADGLSTALSVLPASQAATLIKGRVRAYAVPVDGGPGHWL